MPQAIEDRPQVGEHLNFVWCAFAQLRTDRQIGLDRGPIMFSSINDYADRYGIVGDIDEFDRFVVLIRAMDAEERKFKRD